MTSDTPAELAIELLREMGSGDRSPEEYDSAADAVAALASELADLRATVSRVWTALGDPSMESLEGRTIWEEVERLRAELADLRAAHNSLKEVWQTELKKALAAEVEVEALRAEMERLTAALRLAEQSHRLAESQLDDALALLGDMADKLGLIQRGLEYGDHQTTEIDLLLARGQAASAREETP